MVPQNVRRSDGARWLAAASTALGLMLVQAAPAHAALDCLPLGQPLPKIPELVSDRGVLRGTMLLSNEQQRIAFRSPPGLGNVPGRPGLYSVCQEQYVRFFRGVNARPAPPPVPAGQVANPMPGPTLRARVGDIIQLTFLNQINPANFGNSIDQAETGKGNGCDSSTAGYPTAGGDSFPDCFHGSSTGNIHFHGTHTNPNGTGDNVFLEVRPSPRVNGKPTITADTVKKPFDAFFKACEAKLKADVFAEWPMTWNDAPLGPWTDPKTWTGQQAALLQAYDQGKPLPQQLWPIDQQQIAQNLWPQYYIGAFPYCFQVPEYKLATWPPPPGGLRMGQSPGTHWYHAHKHGSTAINVANGMTGVFIIEGKYDDDLNTWYGPGWTQRQPVMVINQLGVSPNLLRSGSGRGATDKGPDFSVNGRQQPVLEMRPGEVQLWRIANTSGRSGAFFLGPTPGFSWRQIAQDGVQFADANYQSSQNKPFLMASGNRVDLLVKAPTTPAVYPILVQHQVDPSDLSGAYPVILLSVRIRADAKPVTGNQAQFIPKAPTQPPFLTDITDDEVKETINNPRVVAFASTPPPNPPQSPNYAMHTINGQKFDASVVGEKVWLNRVEEWKITNATAQPNISHPFHIHVNPFQIVEVFNPNDTITYNGTVYPKYVFYPNSNSPPGQCILNPADPSSWKPCTPSTVPSPRVWWDVFPIPSGLYATDQAGNQILINGKPVLVPGYFKMRSRFVDYPGWYVLHCHILAHEDRGMMTVVQVTAAKDAPTAKPPFVHH